MRGDMEIKLVGRGKIFSWESKDHCLICKTKLNECEYRTCKLHTLNLHTFWIRHLRKLTDFLLDKNIRLFKSCNHINTCDVCRKPMINVTKRRRHCVECTNLTLPQLQQKCKELFKIIEKEKIKWH